jgi:hypothetical protein
MRTTTLFYRLFYAEILSNGLAFLQGQQRDKADDARCVGHLALVRYPASIQNLKNILNLKGLNVAMTSHTTR